MNKNRYLTRRIGCQLLTACAVLLCATLVYAASPRVAVEAEGVGVTKMEALQSAWMDAVRNAVGMFLNSKTEMIDDKLTEQIVTHSRGQVNSYQVLSERKDNGIWTVKIRANIDRDILQEATQAKTSQKIAISADDQAKIVSQIKKKQSAADLIDSSLELIDFKNCLDYQAKLKILDDGSVNVIHILRMDFNKYTAQTKELEKVLSAIARKKTEYAFSWEQKEAKKFVETLKLKNFAFPDKPGIYLIGSDYVDFLKKGDTQTYYKNKYVSGFNKSYGIRQPIKDKYVVSIFKNSSTGIIYELPQQVYSIIVEEKNQKYELFFSVENTKDETDTVIKRDRAPFNLSIGKIFLSNSYDGLYLIDVWPGILCYNYPASGEAVFTAVIYVQNINLDQDAVMDINYLGASYELVPVN